MEGTNGRPEGRVVAGNGRFVVASRRGIVSEVVLMLPGSFQVAVTVMLMLGECI